MITYRMNLYDNTNTVLMFAEGFDSAYDAYTFTADEFKALNALPSNSLFHIVFADVWMYEDGNKVKRMWSFGCNE